MTKSISKQKCFGIDYFQSLPIKPVSPRSVSFIVESYFKGCPEESSWCQDTEGDSNEVNKRLRHSRKQWLSQDVKDHDIKGDSDVLNKMLQYIYQEIKRKSWDYLLLGVFQDKEGWQRGNKERHQPFLIRLASGFHVLFQHLEPLFSEGSNQRGHASRNEVTARVVQVGGCGVVPLRWQLMQDNKVLCSYLGSESEKS